MELSSTIVFEQTLAANTRLIVHQGGARSSKTYSIIQYLLYKAINTKGLKITIARSALTNLKDTAYKDFIDVISQAGIATRFSTHLSSLTYTLKDSRSEIQFIGLDDPLKLHGRKQDIFWFNEANYCTYEDFRQVNSRTTGQIIMDFNPSDLYHWIYEKILTREDCTLIKSTYLDNPFLPKEIVAEIEAAREADPDWFKVYGMGERASSKDLIYPRYEYYHEEPQGCRVMYGLDFGYNHPSALVKCSYRDGELYARELLYQSYLTTPDLIAALTAVVDKRAEIYADGARPEIIADIRKAGFNIKSATKEVKHGIDKVKSQKLFVNGENLVKEIQNYKWKRHNATDTVLEEPVKANDDACFIGSTMVFTYTGNKPISEIKVGDMVLTRNGYKKVLNVFNNGEKRVNKYSMQCGTISVYLCATNNHLISTNNEWTKISQLKQGQTICHIKHLMAKDTNSTPAEDTSCSISTICTIRFGNTIKAKDLKGIMYTILTAIRGIIELTILNLLKLKNTILNTLNKNLLITQIGLKNFKQKVLKPQRNGTQQKRVLSGIDNTQQKFGIMHLLKHYYAKSVERNTIQETEVFQNTAIKTAKLLHLDVDESWIEQVYDIEVEDCHEYFANGVLVHNCDAMRYGCYHLVSKPLTKQRVQLVAGR